MEYAFSMIILMLMVFGMIMVFKWVGLDLSNRRVDHDSVLSAEVLNDVGKCLDWDRCYFTSNEDGSFLVDGQAGCCGEFPKGPWPVIPLWSKEMPNYCCDEHSYQEGPLRQLEPNFSQPTRIKGVFRP